jgi:hypothetical protein
VHWKEFLDNGGAPVSEYQLFYMQSVDTSMKLIGTVHQPNEGLPQFVLSNGLANNTEYQFQVKARNSAGWGNPSQIGVCSTGDASVPKSILPSSFSTLSPYPQNCNNDDSLLWSPPCNPSAGSLAFSWDPPVDSGGVPIHEYIVRYEVQHQVYTEASPGKVAIKMSEYYGLVGKGLGPGCKFKMIAEEISAVCDPKQTNDDGILLYRLAFNKPDPYFNYGVFIRYSIDPSSIDEADPWISVPAGCDSGGGCENPFFAYPVTKVKFTRHTEGKKYWKFIGTVPVRSETVANPFVEYRIQAGSIGGITFDYLAFTDNATQTNSSLDKLIQNTQLPNRFVRNITTKSTDVNIDYALLPNKNYRFYVHPVNAIGIGEGVGYFGPAVKTESSLQSKPGPPLNLKVIAAKTTAGKITLTWDPPSNTGGSLIVGYRVYTGACTELSNCKLRYSECSELDDYSPHLSDGCAKRKNAAVTIATMGRGAGGFRANTEYQFQVIAINEEGKQGVLSSPILYETQKDVAKPDRPEWRVVPFLDKGHPRNSTCPTWRGALDNGGSPIVKYTISYCITIDYINCDGSWEKQEVHMPSKEELVVQPLKSATIFLWKVSATNEGGETSTDSETRVQATETMDRGKISIFSELGDPIVGDPKLFKHADYMVYEDSPLVYVTLTRTEGSSGVVTVLYNTSDVAHGKVCRCNGITRADENSVKWYFEDENGIQHGPFSNPYEESARGLACDYEGCNDCEQRGLENAVYRKSCSAKGCTKHDDNCDYKLIPETEISFLDGEIRKVLPIKLFPDDVCERPNELFAVHVKELNSSNLEGLVADPVQTRIMIREDGDAGGVEFDKATLIDSTFSIQENQGQARFRIVRKKSASSFVGAGGNSGEITVQWYTKRGSASPGQTLDGSGDYRPHPNEDSLTLGKFNFDASISKFPYKDIQFVDSSTERYVDLVVINDDVYDYHPSKLSERDVEDLEIHLRLRDEDKDPNDETLGFVKGLKICTPYLLNDPLNKGYQTESDSISSALIKITDDGDEQEPYTPSPPTTHYTTGGSIQIKAVRPLHVGGRAQRLVAYDFQKCVHQDDSMCIECYLYSGIENECLQHLSEKTNENLCTYDVKTKVCSGGWFYVAKNVLLGRTEHLDSIKPESITLSPEGVTTGYAYFKDAVNTIQMEYVFDEPTQTAFFKDIGLDLNTKYNYRVAAVNSYGACERVVSKPNPADDFCKSFAANPACGFPGETCSSCKQRLCKARAECKWDNDACVHNGRGDRMCIRKKEKKPNTHDKNACINDFECTWFESSSRCDCFKVTLTDNEKECNRDVRCRWMEDTGTCVLSGRSDWSPPHLASTSVQATGPGAPSSPVIVEGTTTTGGMVTLKWDAPGDTGGQPITRYRVFMSNGFGGYETVYEKEAGFIARNTVLKNLPGISLVAELSSPRATVVGGFDAVMKALTNYFFVVSAENSVAVGARSAPLNTSTTSPTPPSRPFFYCNCFSVPAGCAAEECTCSTEFCDTTSPSGGMLRISWRKPYDAGGQDIEEYILETDNGDLSKSTSNFTKLYQGNMTEYMWEGLLANTLYRFRVGAINAYVRKHPHLIQYTDVFGEHRTPYTFKTKPITPAGPPRDIIEIYSGNTGGSVKLTWKPPIDTGGVLEQSLKYNVLVTPANPSDDINRCTEEQQKQNINLPWKGGRTRNNPWKPRTKSVEQALQRDRSDDASDFCSGRKGKEVKFPAICFDKNNPSDADGITTDPLSCTVYGYYEQYGINGTKTKQRLWAGEYVNCNGVGINDNTCYETEHFDGYRFSNENNCAELETISLEACKIKAEEKGHLGFMHRKGTCVIPRSGNRFGEGSCEVIRQHSGDLHYMFHKRVSRYKVFIQSVNSVGECNPETLIESESSGNVLTTTPRTLPGRVLDLRSDIQATTGGKMVLIWSPPLDIGGADIVRYKLYLRILKNENNFIKPCIHFFNNADPRCSVAPTSSGSLDPSEWYYVNDDYFSENDPVHENFADLGNTLLQRRITLTGFNFPGQEYTPLKSESTYFFIILPENEKGIPSASSFVVSVTTTAPSQPGSVKSFKCLEDNIAGGNALVQWEPPLDRGGTEIIKYHVFVNNTHAGNGRVAKVYVGNASVLSYRIGGLKANSQHEFFVAAENSAAIADYSKSPELKITTKPPTRPTAVIAPVKVMPSTGGSVHVGYVGPGISQGWCTHSSIDWDMCQSTSETVVNPVFPPSVSETLKLPTRAGKHGNQIDHETTLPLAPCCLPSVDYGGAPASSIQLFIRTVGSEFVPIEPENVAYDKWSTGIGNMSYHKFNKERKRFERPIATGIGNDYFPAMTIANLKPLTNYKFKARLFTEGAVGYFDTPVVTISTTLSTPPSQPMGLVEASKSGGGFTVMFIPPQDFGGDKIRKYAVYLKLIGSPSDDQERYQKDVDYGELSTYINPDPNVELQPRLSVPVETYFKDTNENSPTFQRITKVMRLQNQVVIVNLLAGKTYSVSLRAVSNPHYIEDVGEHFSFNYETHDTCKINKRREFDANGDTVIDAATEVTNECFLYEDDKEGTISATLQISTSQPSPPTWGATIDSLQENPAARTVGSITVTWKPPADDGGVGGNLWYRVETMLHNDTGAAWSDIPPKEVSNTNTATVDGLAQETQYRVRVIAINACCKENCAPDHCESKTDLLSETGEPIVNSTTGKVIRILQTTREVIARTGSNIAAPDPPRKGCVSNKELTLAWSDAPNVRACEYIGFKLFMKECEEQDAYCNSGGQIASNEFSPLRYKDGNVIFPRIVQYERPTKEKRYNFTIGNLRAGRTYHFKILALNRTTYKTQQAKDACIRNDIVNCVTDPNGVFFTEGEGPLSVKSSFIKIPDTESTISCVGGQEDLHRRNDSYFENRIYQEGSIQWNILPSREMWTAAAPELTVRSTMELTFSQFDLECDHDKLTIQYLDGTHVWSGGCTRRTPFTITLPRLLSKGLIPMKYQNGANGVVLNLTADDSLFYPGVRFSYVTRPHHPYAEDRSDDLSKIPCPERCEEDGHGICTTPGICKCTPGFIGEDCSSWAICPGHRLCPDESFFSSPEKLLRLPDFTKSILLVDSRARDRQGNGAPMVLHRNNGTVGKPFKHLSDAMNNAKEDDLILVFPGIYEHVALDCGLIAFEKKLTLESLLYTPIRASKGQFFSMNSHQTKVDCSYLSPFLHSKQSSLTLRGINIHNTFSNSSGGLMLAEASEIVIENCDFEQSKATRGGGIFASLDSTITLSNTTLRSCVASKNGGAFYLQDASLTLAYSKVFFSRADQRGGGAFLSGKHAALKGLGVAEISNNDANVGGNIGIDAGTSSSINNVKIALGKAVYGGGVHIDSATLNLRHTNIVNNEASKDGGGIYTTNSSTVFMEHSHIFDNEAENGGGVFSMSNLFLSGAHVYTNTIVQNKAARSGGGMFTFGGLTTEIGSVIISSNTAINGAGIHNSGGRLIILNAIINTNVATKHGGGLHIDEKTELILTDSILDQNSANEGGGIATDDFFGPNAINGKNTTVSQNLAFSCGGNILLQGGSQPLYVLGIDRDAGGCDSTAVEGLNILRGRSLNNGGGLCIPDCAGHLKDTVVAENHADNNGGGFYHSGHTVYMRQVSILKNTAGNDGGGVYMIGKSAEILGDLSISWNKAMRYGGGVALYDGKGMIAFHGKRMAQPVIGVKSNHASRGGGMYVTGGVPLLDSVAISENHVGSVLDGIFVDGQGGGILTERVPEVQRIFCVASAGELELSFEGTDTVIVPATMFSENNLRAVLYRLRNRTVDVEYKGGNNPCSPQGVETFLRYTDPADGGDMPLLSAKSGKTGNNILSLNRIREKQQVTCVGSKGKFSISFGNKMTHINFNDYSESVTLKLKNELGLEDVSVVFETPTACRPDGNKIIFEFFGLSELGDQPQLDVESLDPSLNVQVTTLADGVSGAVRSNGPTYVLKAPESNPFAVIEITEVQKGYSSPALSLVKVDILRNAALGPQGSGGGIYANEGLMLHMDSSVANNKAAVGGGLFFGVEGGFEHISEDPKIPGRITEKLNINSNEACLVWKGINEYIKSNPQTYERMWNAYPGGACYAISSGQESGPGKYLGGNMALYGNAVLSGLKISGGSAESGGAVYIHSRSKSGLDECFINDNTATVNGGGLYMSKESSVFLSTVALNRNKARYGAGVYLDQCKLSHFGSSLVNNTASRQGGGIYLMDNSEFVGTKTSLEGNAVEAVVGDVTTDALGGAGVYVKGQGFLLSGLRASGSVSEKGGAVFVNKDAKGTFSNSIFRSNRATHSDGGGGLYIDEQCDVTFIACEFGYNYAVRGGGTTISAAKATLKDSVFIGNTAGLEGGGIWLRGEGSYLKCENVTFAGNTVLNGRGGGLAMSDSTTPASPPSADVLRSLFVGNSAPLGNGGGVFLDKTMKLSIFDSVFHGGFANIWTEDKVDKSFVWCRHTQAKYNFVPGQNFGSLERKPGFSTDTHPVVKIWIKFNCITKVVNALNGGAIYAGGASTLTISSSNLKLSNASAGGALYVEKDTQVHIFRSTVELNRAQFGAGVSFVLSSRGNITESILQRNQAQYDGGGAYIEDAKVTMSRVQFTRNLAEARAGGVYVDKGGIFTAVGNTFKENAARGEGGAVYMGHNARGNLKGCNFVGNWAKESAGAVFITATKDVTISDDREGGNLCSFVNNSVNNSETDTTGNGGAIEVARYGAGTVSGCEFSNNLALKGNGGVASADGRDVVLTFDRSSFQSNIAKYGGCFYLSIRAQMTVSHSFAVNNKAIFDGGVFYENEESSLIWLHTESVGNSASRSGGVGFANDASALMISLSTFRRNSASFYGGVLYLTHVKSPTPGGIGFTKVVHVKHSSLIENAAKQGGSVYWPYTNENPESLFVPVGCTLRDNSPTRDGLATGTVRVRLNRWHPSVRSGRLVSELAPLNKAPFVETLDYYSRISNLDNINSCDVRPLERKVLKLSKTVLVRENAEVYGGTLIKAVDGVMRFSDLVIRGDINAMYVFDVQCTIGDPMRVNVSIVPCEVGYALSETRTCELCQKDTYSHEGRSCLPCPDGGNCTATYELRNGIEWVKLNSKRDAETEVEVPFGQMPPELPRVTRGVELPGTLAGFHIHKAPLYRRTFKKGYKIPKGSTYNYFNFSYCYWEQGVCPPGSMQYMTKSGLVECEILGNLSGTRLYNCLVGMHFYRCPQEEVSCPSSEFNGCLGVESPQQLKQVAANADQGKEPYHHLGENQECMGTEERLKPGKQTQTLDGCAKKCAFTPGCEFFDFGQPGTLMEGLCYHEKNKCESTLPAPGLSLYKLNMDEEVNLIFRGLMNATVDNSTNVTIPEEPLPQICNRTCNIGYTGIKCAKCQPFYFRTAAQECQSCAALGSGPEEAKGLYAVMAFGAFVVSSIALWAYLTVDAVATCHSCAHGQCCDSDEEIRIRKMKEEAEHEMMEAQGHHHAKTVHSSKRKHKHKSEHHHHGFRVEKFKILLTFIQIFSQFKSNYSIRWPHKTSEYMRYLAAMNLDIIKIAALDCVVQTDYYFGFLFVISLPIFAILFCHLLFRVGRWYYRRRIKSRYRECLITGEPVYNWMSAKIFRGKLIEVSQKLLEKDPNSYSSQDDIEDKAMELYKKYASDIPPGTSIKDGYFNKPREITEIELEEIIQHNIRKFKWRVLNRINFHTYVNKLWRLAFWGVLLGYPSISMRVMRIFECEEIDDHFYLVKDYDLECFTAQWMTYASAANAAIFLYVVGCPFAFFYMLWSARNADVALLWDTAVVNEDRMKQLLREAKQESSVVGLFWRDPDTLEDQKKVVLAYLRRRNLRSHKNQNRLGFLYYAYNENRWWYEIVELFRKFSLNGVVVTIQTGQTSKIMFGTILCLGFLVLVQNIHPHKAESDHVLTVVAHMQLFVTMFAGLLLTEKIQFMDAFITNRREARLKEVEFIETFVITTHLGTLLYGMSCVFYEKYFSPEVMRIMKIEAHHEAVMKQLRASAKKGWKSVSLKRRMIRGKGLLSAKKSQDDSILDLIAESELEDISGTEVKVVTLKDRQQKVMAKLRANRKNAFGIEAGSGAGGLLAALKKPGGGTKVAPTVQIEELRKAQKTIKTAQAQSGSHVDFNWGDDEDEDEEKMRKKLTAGTKEAETTDLNTVQSNLDARAKELRHAFESKRAEDEKAGHSKVVPYSSDRKSVEQAKINLEQAMEGKSLKVLSMELEKIQASERVSTALKTELKAAEVKLREGTADLTKKLTFAMNDSKNPKQLEVLEKALDEVTAAGIKGHDELVQQAVEKMIALEHLVKLRALIEGLNQKTIAEIKSFANPSESIVAVMKAVMLFLGTHPEDVATWKGIVAWIGKTGKQSLKRRIKELDMSTIQSKTVKSIEPLLKGVDLDEIINQSKGVATFYAWLTGMIREIDPNFLNDN